MSTEILGSKNDVYYEITTTRAQKIISLARWKLTESRRVLENPKPERETSYDSS